MADRRLDRRDFLRLGLVAGPASLVAACGWDGGPLIQPRLSAISRFNDWVGEHVLMSSSRLARTYPASARSGTMPSYFVSDTTPLLPDPARWSLEVGGLVRKPTSFTRTMLEALPSVSYTVKHHCVEGWTAISSWAACRPVVRPDAQGRPARMVSGQLTRRAESGGPHTPRSASSTATTGSRPSVFAHRVVADQLRR